MNIKRFWISIFIFSVLFMLPAQVFAFSGQGNGQEWNPYVITTPAHLREVNDDLSATYVLGNDIDMKGQSFSGIGTSSRPFNGRFNGRGYTIRNLTITSTSGNGVGFINYMSGGGIGFIHIENAAVRGADYVGILIGRGTNVTQITGCTTSGTVYGNVGVGGLIGRAEEMEINDSGSTATVTAGSSPNRIGGLVGYATGSLHVSRSYFQGAIEAIAADDVGGIVGRSSGEVTVISQCYANTSYFSANNNAGGIIGSTSSNRTININRCYFTGHFMAGSKSHPIAPSNLSASWSGVEYCYFNTSIGRSSPSSQARSDSQMKNLSNYNGFFLSSWEIDAGNAYPILTENPVMTFAAPTNFKINTLGNSVTLTWDAVSGAKGYEVIYAQNGLRHDSDKVSTSTNSVTISNLSSDKEWEFKVRVRSVGRAGKWTDSIKGTPLITLAVPSAFSAEALTPTSVKLTWNPVKTATGYKINDGSKDITVSGGTTDTYTITNLQPSTQYSFKIMAVRNTESTAYSVVRNVTTPDIGNISGLNYTIEDDNALVSWNANANAQQYIVSVNDAANTVNTNQYTLTDLAYDTDYKVKVQAKFSGYEGPWSSEITINRGPEPFIPPTAIELSSSQIVLTEGESAVLSAIVLPADADDKELEFNIVFNPNTSVELELIDDSSSRINGLNAGMAEIEVKSANYDISETCTVIVEKRRIPVTDIVIYFDETTELTAGEEYPFVCELLPLNATDRDPNIISKHPEIIEISPQGTLLAKSPGTATIRVESNAFDGIFKEIDLVVIEEQTVPEPERILFPDMPKKIVIGKEYPVVFDVEPMGASYEVVEIYSTVPAFFEVIDGIVYPRAEGTAALLIVLDNGVRGVHSMTVVAPVIADEIISPMERTTFAVGEEFEVLYQVLPENADDKNVTITVSNAMALEKTGEKTVKAVGEGRGVIMVTSTANPAARLVLQIDVVSADIPVEDITIAPEHYVMTMQTGETVKLKVDFTPENATNQNLIFDDLIPGFIDVTPDGTVTAVSPGFTVIMIISEDNQSAVEFSNITVMGASRRGAYDYESIADYILSIGDREEIEFYGEYDFYSSNTDIIQIRNGMINAVGEGYAAIIAMDGNKVVSLHIIYVE